MTKQRKGSAITSGRRVFIEGSGSSQWGRRFIDLYRGHISDMGGEENCSEIQISLAKRMSALECELEKLEGQLSLAERVDMDLFGRLVGHLRRVAETLGLERSPRNVTPDLKTYISTNYETREQKE